MYITTKPVNHLLVAEFYLGWYYYVNGNSVLLPNNILVNCQEIEYSANWVYVHTTGIPAYPTGPFLDGNPSQATNQSGIFKITLNPVPNTGAPTATTRRISRTSAQGIGGCIP